VFKLGDVRISALCETWQESNTEVDYHKFWCSCVPNNVWYALVATKYQCGSTWLQELFHTFCGIGESTVEAYRVGQVCTYFFNLYAVFMYSTYVMIVFAINQQSCQK